LPILNLELFDGDWATIWQNAHEYTPKTPSPMLAMMNNYVENSGMASGKL
jgi:hypothetical protein